jgi:UDP-N-acetylmuramyl pentapeptide phosphotransferase/UDP-N-acetylglucosamine-1-phosphate transferase
MNFDILKWVDPSSFIYVFLAFILNAVVAILWHKKIYKKFGLKVYTAIQRIHLAETPRLGGLIIISVLSLYAYLHAEPQVADILKLCLWSMLPLVIVALKEDLFQDVRPALRLAALLSSGTIFVTYFSGPYPNFDGTFLDLFFRHPIALFFFYPLALSALANGSNLIDGVNGLCGMIFLSILGSLLFLAYQVSDNTIMMVILIIMMLIGAFLCFNYPSGKIFLGDLGAYVLAFLTGMITIMFLGRHINLSPWFAVLILIYPMTEVAFSISRRLYRNKPVFAPDIKHLHIKIFYFLRRIRETKRLANPTVTLLLAILWMYPLILTPWASKKPSLILLFIFFFFLIYGVLYRAVPTPKVKDSKAR